MGANFTAKLTTIRNSVLRLAAALTLALVGTAAISFSAYWAYTSPEREQARKAEVTRAWASDLSTNLGMKLRARTKFVDSRMHVALEFDGFPEYLEQPLNWNRGFRFEWADADGFTRVTKFLKVSEFSRHVNDKGQPKGLNAQFTEYATLDDYIKLTGLNVVWTVDTDIVKQSPPAPNPPAALVPKAAVDDATSSDHCTPGLSRSERLRRLAQHGPVRETGLGGFSAGTRTVTFIAGTSDLISCQ